MDRVRGEARRLLGEPLAGDPAGLFPLRATVRAGPHPHCSAEDTRATVLGAQNTS